MYNAFHDRIILPAKYYPAPDLARLSPPRGLGDKLNQHRNGSSRKRIVCIETGVLVGTAPTRLSAPGEHRVAAAESCSESSDSDTETPANTAAGRSGDNDNEYANIPTNTDKTSDLGENSSEVKCDESDLVDNCKESKGEVNDNESDSNQVVAYPTQYSFKDNFYKEEKQEEDEGKTA